MTEPNIGTETEPAGFVQSPEHIATETRYDLHVLQELQASGDIVSTIAQLRRDAMDVAHSARFWDEPRLAALCPEAKQRRTMMSHYLDYALEAYLLNDMSDATATRYVKTNAALYRYHGFDKVLHRDGPLLLETSHHRHLGFQLFAFCARLRPVMILMRRNDEIDDRVRATAALAEREFGVETLSIQMVDDWQTQLRDVVGPDSCIVYMGDMPPTAFPGRAGKRTGRARLNLISDDDTILAGLSTVSFAPSLARQFDAHHLRLDFRDQNVLIAPAEPGAALKIPLLHWALWPSLALYDYHDLIAQ
jgi:hypothetical protein